jgi:hypothetical protein
MKPIALKSVRRAALVLSAAGLLLAPLAAQSREREETELNDRRQDSQRLEEPTGRGGAIEEFNFGPSGMPIGLDGDDRRDEGGTRLLSGRVVDIQGRTLYVERQGVVIPLDMSALRINKTPKVGQQVVAEYQVDQTRNIALSLAGEVTPPPAAQ